MFKSLPSLAVGACLLSFASAKSTPLQTPTSQVDANRVVAVVNGEEIKGGEYYHRMEYLPGVGITVGTSLIQFPPGLLALDRLVTERLTLQLATDDGVAPKDAEVDQAYRDALTTNPNLEKDWIAQGNTLDDLRQQIRLQEARFKIVTAGINITDQEVQTEYDQHPDRYTTPKLMELRAIVADTDAVKAAVDTDLAAGKDFGEVAKAQSVDVTKARGGALGKLPYDSLPDEVKTGLTGVKIGKTTGWIRIAKQPAEGTLYEKILFVGASDAKLNPLTDILKANIRRRMMYEKGSIQHDLNKEMKAMLGKAKVEIKDPVFAEAWKQFQARAAAN